MMERSVSRTEAVVINELSELFSGSITNTLKSLFETKHLYQSLRITQPQEHVNSVKGPNVRDAFAKEDAYKEAFLSMCAASWDVRNNAGPRARVALYEQGIGTSYISFSTPDVRLFCTSCKRAEAFNSISTEEFLARGTSTGYGEVQVFVFSFLCQSCKSIPEVFIVRREGLKLTLCGRAPIEHVEVPTVIPDRVAQYFGGAVVAYQSGQTLAANFMLRTVIEQWVRFVVRADEPTKSDVALQRYMDGLPEDFKQRFPSLVDLYGLLSTDIHRADGNSELFEESSDKVILHFDALRLYRLFRTDENS